MLKGQYARTDLLSEGENKWWSGATGWNGSGTKEVSGFPVNADSALNSSAAFACTRAIAETLASLPAVVYDKLGSNARQRAETNPMWELIHKQPNPWMDSTTWYGLNIKRLVNRGNAVNIIEYNRRGRPIALWPVHNSRWMAYKGPSRQKGDRYYPGDLFYRVWPDETGKFYDVGQEDVLNIVGFDTDDGVVARGVPDRAKGEISLSMAQQEYSSSMLSNGAVPLGLIKHPWIPDDEQRQNFRNDINSLHTGRENWNRVGILWDKDAEWTGLNFSPKDVEAIQSRQYTDKSICRFYNVPPAIVQIFDDYKFATVEAMLKHFVTLCLRVHAVRMERAINLQVLDNFDDAVFMEFLLDALLRGDPKAQAETNAVLRQWGALNADEWRSTLDFNPLPNKEGQAFLGPSNYTTLGRIVSGENLKSDNGGGSANGQSGSDQKQKAQFSKVHLAALIKTARHELPPEESITEIRGEDSVEETSKSFEIAKSVLQHQLSYMTKNEQKALTKICATDYDHAGVTEFYSNGKFQTALTSALNIESVCKELGVNAEDLADRHCRKSLSLFEQWKTQRFAPNAQTLSELLASFTNRKIEWSDNNAQNAD